MCEQVLKNPVPLTYYTGVWNILPKDVTKAEDSILHPSQKSNWQNFRDAAGVCVTEAPFLPVAA